MPDTGHGLLRAAELEAIDRIDRPVLGLATDYPAGHHIPPHRHAKAQLVYASAGVMTVRAAAGSWVVPPQGAVWMPAGERHAIDCHGRLQMRSLYFSAAAAAGLPAACRVLSVTPLLRELILRVVALPYDYPPDGAAGRLVPVIRDEIAGQPSAPLHLPMADEPRLRRVIDGLLAAPGDAAPLEDWAARARVSARTLARLFRRHTGLGFRDWRRQARLMQALAWLSEGRPVTTVALDLGYDSPSAFIAMFRQALGTTPGRLLGRGG